MQKASIGGSRYFLLIKDDYLHFRFVYCTKQKSEVIEKVRIFVIVAQSIGHRVSVVRSDNGTEFINAELRKFLEQNGIRYQKSVPYTPEQNGSAERDMRSITTTKTIS